MNNELKSKFFKQEMKVKKIHHKRLNQLNQMQNKLILCLALMLSQLSFGQLKVSERAQLNFNKFNNEFFVLDDSTHYWTQKPGSHRWVRHSFVYDVKQPFKEVMEMTKVLSMAKNRYYFVHESCGNVYELYKDTLKRIDESFPHRNQYGAPMFAWNGNVFMFGGYGFFQVKDVFTRYLPSAKEWFEVNVKSAEMPSRRSAPLFVVDQDQFYLLGGLCRDHLKDLYLRDCWKYDFRTKRWKQLGEIHELLYNKLSIMKLNVNLPNEVLLVNNRMIELNIRNNSWSSYENPMFLNMHKITSSRDNKYLMYILSNSNNLNDLQVEVRNSKSFKELKVGTYPIYQKISVFKQFPKEDYLWISLILNFLLFTLLFYIRRMHKVRFLQRSQKKLLKSDFSSTEWEVLSLIRNNGEMELSALNTYFNEAGLSHETLKKRRESFVKNIRIKIAFITRKPIDEILIESKHNVDKRMKIIHWNEDIELVADPISVK
jgi:hypothetical protein